MRRKQMLDQFIFWYPYLLIVVSTVGTVVVVSSKFKKSTLKSLEVEDYHAGKPLSNSEYEQLVVQLEGIFENMKFSDITVNVRGREFPAHKNILVARSSFFDVMFDLSSNVETNQIKVDDVEPEVFHEILRFIYTGRVSETAMKTMPVEMFAVANKYLLDHLKRECEIQLIYRMSPNNCLQLLLTDEQHPAFILRKYAVDYFRSKPGQVMATEDWIKAKQDHPEKCFNILQDLAASLDLATGQIS